MRKTRLKPKQLRINLGCGTNKLPDFVNVDAEPSCKPDLLWDFVKKPLPYSAGIAEEITMFHTIEHIAKPLHRMILAEIWRLLQPGGQLFISYPEFTKVYENWKSNYRGNREFWENTIFGRQLYSGDAHVCIMHTPHFIHTLRASGFTEIASCPEIKEPFNTVVSCQKGQKAISYENLIKSDMEGHRFRKVGAA